MEFLFSMRLRNIIFDLREFKTTKISRKGFFIYVNNPLISALENAKNLD